jgi:nucleoside-diphosphate-sugar epimerase
MKILVTGAQGYIGTLLTAHLLARGHAVVGLDTGFFNDGWLYHADLPVPECIRKDVRSIREEDLIGFDAVVHLAELSNDPLGELRPEITHEINYLGSTGLARKCKSARVPRFVYASSCSVYGVGDGEYKTEESTPVPQTAYARCKVLVEQELSRMADDDFSPTMLRNATAYGPSPRMRFDLVLNNLAGWAWTSKEIRLTSDGTPHRPLAHVLDICEAMACTLEAPREAVHGQIFNVGQTRENYRISEIADIVASVLPGCRVTLGTRDGDTRSYRVSFDKIQAMLPGFKARRTAQDGARELVELFERIQLCAETFEFRAFTRVKQLKYLVESGQIDAGFFWRRADG